MGPVKTIGYTRCRYSKDVNISITDDEATPVASTTPVPEHVAPTEDLEEAGSTTPVPEPATPTDQEVDMSERLGASGASEGAAEPAGGASAQSVQEDKLRSEAAAAAVEPSKNEADESIAEDISIATDSELERVISSAAAAVEEFSGHMGAEPGTEESSEGSDNIFVLRDKATAQLEKGGLYCLNSKQNYELGHLTPVLRLFSTQICRSQLHGCC